MASVCRPCSAGRDERARDIAAVTDTTAPILSVARVSHQPDAWFADHDPAHPVAGAGSSPTDPSDPFAADVITGEARLATGGRRAVRPCAAERDKGGVAVLNVVALTNGEYLISSVALGVEEYYLGLGEAPGTWDGGWGARLGVSGEVQAEALRALIDGRHPVTGDELMTQLRPRRVKAFDLSFSAPKSVSLLWAFASPVTAEAVAPPTTRRWP